MSISMSSIEAAEALAVARNVASEAASLLRGAVGNVGRVSSKQNPRDLVTEWDTRCEDLIRTRLDEQLPGIPVLGEEGGASHTPSGSQGSEYQWLVDPIDGTVNFAHGLPIFAVAISLEHRGQAIAGVVHAPVFGWEFYGMRGGGAFMNGERMAVSRTASLGEALMVSGFPYDRATNPNNNFAEWEHFQRRAGACRRLGAASLDLCFVARGWFDGYWEYRLNPWDVSAGALLVEEAGGRITGLDGSPFSSSRGDVVASNGIIHAEILDELAKVRRA